MSDFPAELLPVRFRRDCPQMRAASFYWVAWHFIGALGTSDAPSIVRDLPRYRSDVLAAFRAKDWTPADVRQLTVILRRHGFDAGSVERAEKDRLRAREEAGRAAFARGDHDPANVVLLPRRAADRR